MGKRISSLAEIAADLIGFRPPRSHPMDLTDQILTENALSVRDRILNGEPEGRFVNEVMQLVAEAARRQVGLDLRWNQINAAHNLLHRRIVEMPTGEGKTLSVTPALALRAFQGKGVWLATANDYLARRDAEMMTGLFSLLGLTVGYLQSQHSPEQRRAAYQCDITYGTIREFGFDFLRDRLSIRREASSINPFQPLQRGCFSIIVDEADSILLDDARTPLIISEPEELQRLASVFQWSVWVGRRLKEDLDYFSDPAYGKIWLTEEGRSRIRQHVSHEVLNKVTLPQAYEFVSKSVEAEQAFQQNRDYVIQDGKVIIIDRQTGRLAIGRQWQNGIQQAIEAANNLEISSDTNPVAKITIQTFLKNFEHLSGITGTAIEAAAEFKKTYGMSAATIPPFKPCQRKELAFQVLGTRAEKWRSVTQSVKKALQQKRPVLIGTRDLNASEELSEALHNEGVIHQVLTARQEADEAELIARAGQRDAVTVSTNIAGRGTDIKLGQGVAEAGGLHLIAADLFDSSRIDRQLAGRGGRQGDPATYEKIFSLEDRILEIAYEPDVQARKIAAVRGAGDEGRMRLLRSAQRIVEHQHFAVRREMLIRERERIKQLEDIGFDPWLDDRES